MLFAAGGSELSTTLSVKTAWKKFKELLPVLSSCHLSYKTRGHVYSSCFHVIRQSCNVKPEDVATVKSNKLLAQLEIDYLDVILREKASLVWTR